MEIACKGRGKRERDAADNEIQRCAATGCGGEQDAGDRLGGRLAGDRPIARVLSRTSIFPSHWRCVSQLPAGTPAIGAVDYTKKVLDVARVGHSIALHRLTLSLWDLTVLHRIQRRGFQTLCSNGASTFCCYDYSANEVYG